MRAGAEAEWIDNLNGSYSYVHAGECPTEDSKPTRQQNLPQASVEERFRIERCPTCETEWHVPRGERIHEWRCCDEP